MKRKAGMVGCLTAAVLLAGGPANAEAPAAPAPETLFDGHVSKLEYASARHFAFPNGHGEADVFAKAADGFLWFAFVIPNPSVHPGDDMVVMLDVKNAREEAPGKGALRAYVRRKIENSRMEVGDGKGWVDQYGPWEYRAVSVAAGWEVECRIPLAAIGVAADKTVLGFALRIWDDSPQKTYNWPAGSNEKKPNTWGALTLDAGKVIDIVEKP